VAKRAAASPARASTTCRAAASPGRLDRSDTAFRKLPTTWPTPVSPTGKTASICFSASWRAASMPASARVAAASRVRKALCTRLTVSTSTPRPTKPRDVPCGDIVVNSARWRE
jgi:negative regulator of sigma E activity